MYPSPPLDHTALQAALEVKFGGARTYAVYVVELFEKELRLTNRCSLNTSHVQLSGINGVALFTSHGLHYVFIGASIKLKMPSLALAQLWTSELHDAIDKSHSSSSRVKASYSTPPNESPISEAKKPHEHRIFAFPLEMMGVMMFDDQRELKCDSAVGSRNCSASTGDLNDG